MLNQIECEYVDIAKQMGDDINVCEPIDIQKFKAIVCETATFKALISTMKSNQEFRGMTIPDFSEVNPENPASNSIECDLVFEELGFNEDVLADNFTSAELFVKLMARQTNEFFRSFEERTVANIMGVSYEEFRVLSAEERTLFEATSNAANVKNNNNYAKHVEREYQKKYDKQLKQDVLQGKEITITPEELSRINYNPYLTRVVSRLMKEKMLYIEDERAV